MVHRAPFGSMERFVGVLIEHFGGDFPSWLAPEQARVLPISDKVGDYAREVVARLKDAGFRVTLDEHSYKLGAKIRRGSRFPFGPLNSDQRPGGENYRQHHDGNGKDQCIMQTSDLSTDRRGARLP